MEHARRIFAEADNAERTISAARSRRMGVFSITAKPPVTETVLAAAAARFQESHPAVELRIKAATVPSQGRAGLASRLVRQSAHARRSVRPDPHASASLSASAVVIARRFAAHSSRSDMR